MSTANVENAVILRLQGVHAGYNRAPVLRGVDLELRRGGSLGVAGLNGAGKSTLLKVVSGQLEASSGRVEYRGSSLGRSSAVSRTRAGLVFLPEGHQVLKSLTVHENLMLATGARIVRTAVSALKPHIELIHTLFPILHDRSSLPAGLLSGGEQQMLSISRAIVRSPRVLVLDEPSLGLAPVVVAKIYDAIRALREQQDVSLLVVEQSATRLHELCDHLLVLNKGEVVAAGDISELSQEHLRRAYFG